jgi:hypothetical protein
MKKTLLSVAILSTGLGLVGCNEVDQNGELCSYYVKQDMNAKNFDSALSRLETQSCQESYPADGYMVDKGTAYMGRAGTSLPDIMFSLMDSNDEGSEQNGSFQTFVNSMTSTQSATALTDLKLANHVLSEYLVGTGDDERLGVRLINSMVSMAQTTSAIYNLLGGELDSWFDDKSDITDTSEANYKLERATCALEIINLIGTQETCNDTDVITSYSGPGSVTFNDGSTYSTYTVTDVNAVEEMFLAGTPAFMVMTEGFCDVNYATGTEGAAGIYPCPLNRGNGDELGMEDYLLDTLKDGIANIESVVDNLPSVSEEDKADILDSIDEFKTEILAESSKTDIANIEIEDLLAYLNKSESN